MAAPAPPPYQAAPPPPSGTPPAYSAVANPPPAYPGTVTGQPPQRPGMPATQSPQQQNLGGFQQVGLHQQQPGALPQQPMQTAQQPTAAAAPQVIQYPPQQQQQQQQQLLSGATHQPQLLAAAGGGGTFPQQQQQQPLMYMQQPGQQPTAQALQLQQQQLQLQLQQLQLQQQQQQQMAAQQQVPRPLAQQQPPQLYAMNASGSVNTYSAPASSATQPPSIALAPGVSALAPPHPPSLNASQTSPTAYPFAAGGTSPANTSGQFGASGSTTQPLFIVTNGQSQNSVVGNTFTPNSRSGTTTTGSPGPSMSASQSHSHSTTTRPPASPDTWGYAIVDPLHPALQRIPVPPSVVDKTAALAAYNADVAMSSTKPCASTVCLRHESSGGCSLGAACTAFHVKKDYLTTCRNLNDPICCVLHNDYFGREMIRANSVPKLAASRFILILEDRSEVELVASQLSFTVGLEQLSTRGTQSHTKVISAKRHICRLHLEGRCKWTKDCGHVHVCRELLKHVKEFHYPSMHFLLSQDDEEKIYDRVASADNENLKAFLLSTCAQPLIESLIESSKAGALRALHRLGVSFQPAQAAVLQEKFHIAARTNDDVLFSTEDLKFDQSTTSSAGVTNRAIGRPGGSSSTPGNSLTESPWRDGALLSAAAVAAPSQPTNPIDRSPTAAGVVAQVPAAATAGGDLSNSPGGGPDLSFVEFLTTE